jgi:hypothetical protein
MNSPQDKPQQPMSGRATHKARSNRRAPPRRCRSDGGGDNPDVQSDDLEAYLEAHWRRA